MTRNTTSIDDLGLNVAESKNWKDYELLDSGDGRKLERYGDFRFIRPESQALWQPLLPVAEWEKADGVFQESSNKEESKWNLKQGLPARWNIQYRDLTFRVEPTPFRHFGVFPEQASHWDWIRDQISHAQEHVNVLNLFGYTGIASLSAAAAGASVTHVDASKKSITWARENQLLSTLQDKPIRWIVDDALSFVQREIRRGAKYQGIIIDPPKYGRGPKGEVWKLEEMLPILLRECRKLLVDRPLFLVITVYAVRLSSVSLHYALRESIADLGGKVSSGELTIAETGGRRLSPAIYSRWSTQRSLSPVI
jgi:23S rRNA (cytosine1962-C5)-methyltransferase